MNNEDKLTLKQKNKLESKFEKDVVKLYRQNIYSRLESGEMTISDFEKGCCFDQEFEHFLFKKRPNDYKTSILEQARIFAQKKQYDFSVIFYATYFEHFINRIVYWFGIRNKLTENEIIQIIKSSKWEDKLTWVLALLKLPKLNKKFYKILLEISIKRNSFVHYKWNNLGIDRTKTTQSEEDEKSESFILGIESAVKYLNLYESKIFFQGKKMLIREKLKKLPINFKVKILE